MTPALPLHYQTEPISGYTLVGGDMFDHDDTHLARADHAGLELARRAMTRGVGDIVLVGPTAALLLDEVPPERPVSVLVRGTRDAQRLQREAATRPDLRVFCGGLDRFETRPGGLVVALDPLRALVTPDSRPLGVAEGLECLAALTSEDGMLLAEIDNALGFEELHHVPDVSGPDNFDHLAGEPDSGLYHHDLAGVLDHAGLTLAHRYAAAPTTRRPAVLLRSDVANDGAAAQLGRAFALAAAVETPSSTTVLSDPADVVERLFAGHLVDVLAPAWVVVWRRGESVESAASPQLVAVEAHTGGEWRAGVVIDDDATLRPTSREHVASGALERDLGAAYTGTSKGAGLLEADLTRACRRRDLEVVRRAVAAYAAWMSTLPAPEALAATVDNCLVDAELTSFTVLDPSWTWRAPGDAQVVLARSLWRFAQRLVRRTGAHPWTADAEPAQVADALCTMAGLDWPGLEQDVLALEARVASSLRPEAATDPLPQLATPGAAHPQAPVHRAATWRETARANAELRELLAVNKARIEWLERHLEWRDRQFAILEKRMNSVTATTAYKVTDALGAPKRKAVSGARALVMDQLPPGFKDKAEKAVRKMLDDAR